jgi:orotate phosphoribosyltransferase-like protein
MRIRWTDDLKRRAADLSAAGLSAGAIAAQLDVTKDQAASAMTYYGLYASPARPRQRAATSENAS